MTNFDALACRLCNTAGTESCDEAFGHCICKAWYDGDYCHKCRFDESFVLAPNGSCILCPCETRPISECFRNNLCVPGGKTHAKEVLVITAVLAASLIAVACVSCCLLWKLFPRWRTFRLLRVRDGDDGDGWAIGNGGRLGAANGDSRNNLLTTPTSVGETDFCRVEQTTHPTGSVVVVDADLAVVVSSTAAADDDVTTGNELVATEALVEQAQTTCFEYYFLSARDDHSEEDL